MRWFDVRWQHEPFHAYEAEFAEAPAGAVCGEATPAYLHTPGALERIAEACPSVRLVAILRDPVERFWSHYWFRRLAWRADDGSPLDAVEARPDVYVEPGRYGHHLTRARALFAAEQLHVLTIDDYRTDRAGAYVDLCRHLGVAPIVPDRSGTVHNAAHAVRSTAVRTVMLRFHLWRRLPFRLGHRIDRWNRRPITTPPIPRELSEQLRARYADDTATLVDLLGRSVPWAGAPR